MITPVRLSVAGRLNKDEVYENIRNGDYVEAKNVSWSSKEDNSSYSYVEGKIGNRLAFSLDTVNVSGKTIRIQLPQPTGAYQVIVLKTDGVSELFSASFTSPSDFQASFLSAAAAVGLTFSVSFSPGTFAFNINVNMVSYPGYDFNMTSSGLTPFTTVVVQESVANNYTGLLMPIGSTDLLGDLFVFSTPNDKAQEDYIISQFNVTGDGKIIITTMNPHGLQTGNEISITGATPQVGANGVWLVEQVSAFSFVLTLSTFNPTNVPNLLALLQSGVIPTTGTVQKNFRGVGEIGVAQYFENEDAWGYTRLLRSKEFDFDVFHMIEVDSEKNNLGKSLYFHAVKKLPPRAFYYNRDEYVTDGALSINGGQYDYGFISSQLLLVAKPNSLKIDLVTQNQSGGNLKAGNKQYVVRFLASLETATASAWSAPSSLVNVYSENYAGNPQEIAGDISGTPTAKSNVLQISGLNSLGLTAFEVGVIEYIGQSVSGNIFFRGQINADSMTVVHNGNEVTTELDLSTVPNTFQYITSYGSQAIIDNRLVLANIEYKNFVDYSQWTKTFRHSLKYKEIEASYYDGSNFFAGTYQDPSNTFYFRGFPLFETVRFGCNITDTNNNIHGPFFIDDITIDNLPNNSGNPNDNRRIAGLPDLVLNGNGASFTVKVPYVEFSYNTQAYIDGISINASVKEIEFLYIKLDDSKRESLFFGMANCGRLISTAAGVLDDFIADLTVDSSTPVNSIATCPPNSPARRDFLTLFSMDDLYSRSFIFTPGDKIRVLGAGLKTVSQSGGIKLNEGTYNFYKMDGIYQWADYDILDAKVIETEGLVDGLRYVKDTFPGGSDHAQFQPAIVARVSDDIYNNSLNPENGLFYAVYFRPRDNKYSNLDEYVSTNSYGIISGLPINTANVYGSDTFTSVNYVRKKFCTINEIDDENVGAAIATGFIGQSRVNYEMRNFDGDIQQPCWPVFLPNPEYTEKNVFNWLDTRDYDQFAYDTSYNVSQIVTYRRDPTKPDIYDTPARQIWSDLKPQNSLVDNYGYFPALNFKDLDGKDGEITHIANINGELFAWQLRHFTREFFNTTGVLSTAENEIAILGNQGVLSRKGVKISAFGTANKWSVVKGTSKGGNDTVAWFNEENGMVLRFGADGTNAISILFGLMSFFNRSLTYSRGKDSPASGEGIMGIWDERNKEFVWSVRAYRKWQTITGGIQSFSSGEVYRSDRSRLTFNKTPDFFRCKISYINNTAATQNSVTEPGIGSEWQLYWDFIPHTDQEWYNEYSISANDLKTGFSTEYSPVPKFFMRFRNTYVSPMPQSAYGNKIYEHGKGQVCTWYTVTDREGNVVEELSEDGYISPIMNFRPDEAKSMVAIWVMADTIPYGVDFETKNHSSFLLSPDFETRETEFVSTIKNDTRINGLNDSDTSKLWGNWLKVRFRFQPKVLQKLYSIIIPVHQRPRLPNT